MSIADENTVGYAIGDVDNFLERCSQEAQSPAYYQKGGERALAYFRKIVGKFEGWRTENVTLREEVAKLRQEAQTSKPLSPDLKTDYKQMVSLHFNHSGTVCLVYVNPEEGEPFGCGAAYLNDFMQVELESPPFKVALTLPYLLAVHRVLQERSHELPQGRSKSL